MEYVIRDSNGEGVGRVRQSIKPVLPGSGLFYLTCVTAIPKMIWINLPCLLIWSLSWMMQLPLSMSGPVYSRTVHWLLSSPKHCWLSSSLSWWIFYHVHTDTCSKALPEHGILLLQGLIAVCVSGTWVPLFPVFLLFRPHEVPLQCRSQTTPACVLPVLHFSVILKAQGHSSRAEAMGLS